MISDLYASIFFFHGLCGSDQTQIFITEFYNDQF
mgnify:CR=1 FL=1